MSPEKQGLSFVESLKKIDRLLEILRDLQRSREAKKRVRAQDTGKSRGTPTKQVD